MIPVGTQVRDWTVTSPLDAPPGWHELLAEDEAGGCVVLRMRPDAIGAVRIKNEAELARRHLHERVVPSIGLVEHDGWPVQVLEHVDGLTLEQVLHGGRALPPAAVCRVGRQIALALVELHQRAPIVCHGALGPDRILIDEDGDARLTDLGRARPEGHRRCLSPERRVADGDPSVADDLWALGVLLAEAALGRPVQATRDGRLIIPPGVLAERLGYALTALVAPVEVRVKNAHAAVRIFTELARVFGDGTALLQEALLSARLRAMFGDRPEQDASDCIIDDESDVHGARTVSAFAFQAADLAPPRTLRMTGEDFHAVLELRQMAELAQEASQRHARAARTGPVTRPPVRPSRVVLPPLSVAATQGTRAPSRLSAGSSIYILAVTLVALAFSVMMFFQGPTLGR